MYPWWEHPLYLEARAAGASWGFANTDDAYRHVTVYPKEVYLAQISQRGSVIDWDFTQEHPLLWQYEEEGRILCNSPISLEQWARMSNDVMGKMSG